MAYFSDLGADHRRASSVTITNAGGGTAVVSDGEAKSHVTAPSSSSLPIGKLLVGAAILGVGVVAYRKWRK